MNNTEVNALIHMYIQFFSYPIDENLHRHSFHSPPEALDTSRPSIVRLNIPL